MSYLNKQAIQVESAAVDLNSMLDIVFILLIFFIVTTSFVKESGFELTRPTVSKETNTTNQNPVIIILNEHQVKINGRLTDIAQLPAWINLIQAEHDISQISVSAVDNITVNTLVKAIDSIRANTVVPVALINTSH